ncbi:MAG: four helix bundle protein [Clostridia bacterium]|nr:four helix bundle protein [Clostridia bacterium]
MKSKIEEKSFAFAKRIENCYRFLCSEKNEYVLSKQLLRCGTSIGANVSEAQRAQSKADFYTKMTIALKESNETEYWLRLLHETDYISAEEYNSISPDINEIISMLTAITRTVKKQL